jgi:hypothetical protein
MLLEKVIENAQQKPEFDWDSYYSWLFSKYAGREVTSMNFWECTSCLTVNILFLPARYGKCRGCGLIHLPSS